MLRELRVSCYDVKTLSNKRKDWIEVYSKHQQEVVHVCLLFCVSIVVAFEKKFLEKTWPKGINLHVQKRLHKLLSNKTRLCHIIAYIIKWIFLSDKVQPWKCYLLLPLKLFIAFLILPFMYHPNWHFYDGKDSHTNKTKVEHETCMSTCTLNSWPSICKNTFWYKFF